MASGCFKHPCGGRLAIVFSYTTVVAAAALGNNNKKLEKARIFQQIISACQVSMKYVFVHVYVGPKRYARLGIFLPLPAFCSCEWIICLE